MRAEGQDQIEWAERRRCRLKASPGGDNPPHSVTMSCSSSSAKVLKMERHRRGRPQPRKRKGPKASISDETKPRTEESLDPTQAMTRIRQLKSSLAKDPDPPAVAAELALLYLVLSDQRGALRSFQLAVKPSPGE